MAKFLPHGTTVSFNAIPIGGLMSVSFPDAVKEEAETTDTDSGGAREYIPGLRDHGSFDLTVRYDPEDLGQIALEDNFDANPSPTQECIITLPASAAATAVTYTFDAFVISSRDGDLNLVDSTAAEVTFALRVTGDVTKVIAP